MRARPTGARRHHGERGNPRQRVRAGQMQDVPCAPSSVPVDSTRCQVLRHVRTRGTRRTQTCGGGRSMCRVPRARSAGAEPAISTSTAPHRERNGGNSAIPKYRRKDLNPKTPSSCSRAVAGSGHDRPESTRLHLVAGRGPLLQRGGRRRWAGEIGACRQGGDPPSAARGRGGEPSTRCAPFVTCHGVAQGRVVHLVVGHSTLSSACRRVIGSERAIRLPEPTTQNQAHRPR